MSDDIKPLEGYPSDYIGMKNWSDEKQCWVGVVCRIELDDKGEERITVYDVGTAETQVQIGDWIKNSIATRPWEIDGD